MDAEIRAKARALRTQDRAALAAQRAYEEGQFAYHRGHALDTNPKRRHHPQWERGWRDAHAAALAHRERQAAPLTTEERERGLAAIADIKAMLGPA